MYFFVVLTFLFLQTSCEGQIVLFGSCKKVETMKYFNLERFLGKWYQIERFPSWYEDNGGCSYKLIQQCGRRIEFQHVYVKDGIEYTLYVNSTYVPGDEAVFPIEANNIDPYGISLSIITTDYDNYAVVYGCKHNSAMNLKYIVAWILSRNTTLEPDLLDRAHQEIHALPSSDMLYLEKVNYDEKSCSRHWSAHVYAEYNNTFYK